MPLLSETLIRKESGQTLVIVVLTMILALAVGVSVSTRFIKGLSILSRTDSSAKALSAAEGAVERFLTVPDSTLDDYINNNSCGPNCIITYNDGSVATVSLSYLGSTADPITVALNADDVYELKLAGYESGSYIDVCWDGNASITGAYVYKSSGYSQTVFAYNAAGSSELNGFSTASADHGYPSCFRVTTSNTSILIRLRAMYENTFATIFSSPDNSLPQQGYLIEASGKFGDTVKKVSVSRTFKALPVIFDYLLYQKTHDSPLSN